MFLTFNECKGLPRQRRSASRWACRLRQQSATMEGGIVTIVTVGIDLAKNAFAVLGVGESDKPELVPLLGWPWI